ncbi:MAG: hypothetical protein U1E65_17670 [Myxococcota bacterium]
MKSGGLPPKSTPLVQVDSRLENVSIAPDKRRAEAGDDDAFAKGGTSSITRDASADGRFIDAAIGSTRRTLEMVVESREALEANPSPKAAEATKLLGRLSQLVEEITAEPVRLAARGSEQLDPLSHAMTELKLELDAFRAAIVFAELSPEAKKKGLLLDLEKADVRLARALHEVVAERYGQRPPKSTDLDRLRELVRGLSTKALFAEDSGEGHVGGLYRELALAELQRLERATKDGETKGYVSFMRGELAMSQGEFQEAVIAYTRAAEQSPERAAGAYLGQARALAAMGKLDLARQALETALDAAGPTRVPEIRAQIAARPELAAL